MEVELHRALLTARPREDLTLLALCAFGLSRRHRIVPDERAAWERWAAALPADLADEVRGVWDDGEQGASVGDPADRVTVVPGGRAQFGRIPIVLPPNEALALLGRPLRVLLENGRNDRAFVLAFANAASFKRLQEAEREGWIVFETAGGINELAQRLATAQSDPPREVFRTMYLCDSDVREPDSDAQAPAEDGSIADSIQQRLADLAAAFHRPAGSFGRVLGRRAAENYAPPGAVLDWASHAFGARAWEQIQQARTPAGRASLARGTGAAGSARRRLLAAIALKELSPKVRGFLDMKEGRWHRNLRPKADTVRTVDSVWNQLDDFQQAALLDGFGASFSADFYADRRGLHDETGEITGLLATLLERL